jgi:hypothetical protein
MKKIFAIAASSVLLFSCAKIMEKKELNFNDNMNDISQWEIEYTPFVKGDTAYVGKVEALNGTMNIEVVKGTITAKKQMIASPSGALRNIQMKIRVDFSERNGQSMNELIVHYRGQSIRYKLEDWMKQRELIFDYNFGKKMPRSIDSEPMYIQHYDTIPNNEIIFTVTGKNAMPGKYAARLAIDNIEITAH